MNDDPTPEPAGPLIWVLTGDHVGDNVQVLHAADALGCAYERRHMVVFARYAGKPLPVEPALYHVDINSSARLEAPWPDLLITIGRRLSMVALWVKQQSGGKTRIALFNVPKGLAEQFDLLVIPSIYRYKGAANICRIAFPLSAIDQQRIITDSRLYVDSIGVMDRPINALLLGGDAGRQRLDPGYACYVLKQLQRGLAGSVFVSSSRRTAPAVIDALEKLLRPHDRLYRWIPDSSGNPYFALLGLCDTFTVTSDSMSMMTEIARLGKPLTIAQVPDAMRPIMVLADWLGMDKLKDLNRATRYLLKHGHATHLGEAPRPPVQPLPEETPRVVEALRKLAARR